MTPTISESTKFFGKKSEASEFVQRTSERKDYTVLDYGKSGRSFYVKYKKEKKK